MATREDHDDKEKREEDETHGRRERRGGCVGEHAGVCDQNLVW